MEGGESGDVITYDTAFRFFFQMARANRHPLCKGCLCLAHLAQRSLFSCSALLGPPFSVTPFYVYVRLLYVMFVFLV